MKYSTLQYQSLVSLKVQCSTAHYRTYHWIVLSRNVIENSIRPFSSGLRNLFKNSLPSVRQSVSHWNLQSFSEPSPGSGLVFSQQTVCLIKDLIYVVLCVCLIHFISRYAADILWSWIYISQGEQKFFNDLDLYQLHYI